MQTKFSVKLVRNEYKVYRKTFGKVALDEGITQELTIMINSIFWLIYRFYFYWLMC